ncbi:Nascent polypeptide-associated complex subunit alpha [Lasiodiplodia hormozganensis]|uniref:Nascent polypeptide-associated complex subunit alpha n=1 Tax=Lasiodiplodia hormozganensis TaxID=869390 RepID=A0AA39YJL5_9PEZI|nr:Nascent polypeptide-associated complex subunit alpha [Lasiodiplodia hormozganensis]
MASAGAHSHPPSNTPPSVDMENNRPCIVLAEVAGKALFSTKLGQIAPRPVPDPPEPVIARTPNVNLECSHQIDRFVQQLRDEFPAQCNEIFVGYYTIHDYFDAYDIHRLGERHVASALDRIATQNSTAVQNFVAEWCPRNHPKVQKICYGTTLLELFSEAEIKERGELFLTIAVISIRNALESTAKKQEAQAKDRTRVISSPNEEATVKQEVPHAESSRIDQGQTSRVPPGLLRVEWRQPHQSSAAQVGTVPSLEPVHPPSVAVHPASAIRRGSQASTSVPVTPTLSQKSPYLAAKSHPSKSTPRVQAYHSNTGMIPSTHQRHRSTPRMNAMTPGFVPQSSMGVPTSAPPTRGPPSQAATPQTIGAQLYLPPAPFQGIPHGFEVGAMHREINPFPSFTGNPNLHSNSPDMPYAATQATPHMPVAQPSGAPGPAYMPIPTLTSPPMLPPHLANMTNLQYGGTMPSMRSRRMSGPALRQDYGSRFQGKQAGKGSRGGRRNSMRGNHIGGTFRDPAAGQLGPAAAARELKAFFESQLHRPVVDVKVSIDKRNRPFAHVNMTTFQDANMALHLDEALFFGYPLVVKIPAKAESLLPEGYDLKKGYPLSAPAQFAQTPTIRHTVPFVPIETSAMEPFGQDHARRMQPIEVSKQAVGDTPQAPQSHPAPTTATSSTEDPGQRPDSRCSSSANSTKQKKRKIIRSKKADSNKSRSGTTTPEPSTTGSMERAATTERQSQMESATKLHGDDAGLVDKKITTILERREQEKKQKPTSSSDSQNQKDVPSADVAVESKDSEFERTKEKTNARDQESNHSASSTEQGNVAGSEERSGAVKAEKPSSALRQAKVAVPDINIYCRKEKQGSLSAASSTRVSYAQAAASAKAATVAANSARSPIPEREAESRYYTPIETLHSPHSTKSEKTLSPGTPMKGTTSQVEDATPEKDDSFVTVQEEPPLAAKEQKERGDSPQEADEQIHDSRTVSPEAADIPTTPPAEEEYVQVEVALPTTAALADQQVSLAQTEAISANERTASWAEDVAAYAKSSSPIEMRPDEGEAADQTGNISMESSTVAEGSAKTTSQDTGSIHPNARPKGDKKKQSKKGKSYGKGKKGTSVHK